jgi:hypothetical protein
MKSPTVAEAVSSSNHPTPTPRFDFGKFAKESGTCTLVPAADSSVVGESLRTSQSLENMLSEVERGWDEQPPNQSGERLIPSAVLEIDLAAPIDELSHRERFVLMHVDGVSSVLALGGLLESVGLESDATELMLASLAERGFVRPKKQTSGIRDVGAIAGKAGAESAHRAKTAPPRRQAD